MKIALINDGIVQNIIEADLAFAQTLGYETVVEATDGAYPGGQYADGAFVPTPTLPPVPLLPNDPVVSKLAFLSRFTQNERISIRVQLTADPIIEDANQMLSLADMVDLTHADTQQYVGYLGMKGYLTDARVAEILTP